MGQPLKASVSSFWTAGIGNYFFSVMGQKVSILGFVDSLCHNDPSCHHSRMTARTTPNWVGVPVFNGSFIYKKQPEGWVHGGSTPGKGWVLHGQQGVK